MNPPMLQLESSESLARDEPEQSPTSSAATKPLSVDGQTPETPPLTVAVAIRHGRVLVLTTLMLGVILGLVFTFKQGVEVSRFDAKTRNATQREKLLDDYNSYSGNVASAFGKPIEVFVASLAQIVTLRFLARGFTQPNTSWQLGAATLALGACTGYLISNGFNALNIQLRPQEIHAVIVPSDLSVASNISDSVLALTTSVTHTVSENTPRNLISNTVLRNAVMPRVTFKQDLCDWVQTRLERSSKVEPPLPTVDYGFTQRDWQSRLLREALEPKTLRIVVNPTNATANDNTKSSDLPMNASTAADLLLYVLSVGPNVFPWGAYNDYVDTADIEKRYPKTSPNYGKPSFVEATARVVGLLPPSSADEAAQREWLLNATHSVVKRQFENSTNTSREDIGITFSRVDISPQISFDAVTFEVAVDPTLLATASSQGNKTRYTQVQQANEPGVSSDCGPWPALCVFPKPTYQPQLDPFTVDALQQVHAFGSCENADGTPELRSLEFPTPTFRCTNASNSSMMVMSVGRRLEADSFVQNKTDNVSKKDGKPALATNLRKIYSFTIGRLSWKLANLSTTFHAECRVNASSHECLGLTVPLSAASVGEDGLAAGEVAAASQVLVVSADALPTSLIVPSTRLFDYKPRGVSLVEVSEPVVSIALAGDVLLPHNSKDIVWDNVTVSETCDADIEVQLSTKLNNHLYIEHGFQTAYTAATFFLLQNAVVKDTIVGEKATTLSFDGNTQDVVVWASTPQQNAWLTLAGCVLLVVCLVAVVVETTRVGSNHQDPLAAISDPQAIARVLLDDEQFPSKLLHRRVVGPHEQLRTQQFQELAITALVVEHRASSSTAAAP